MRNRQLHDALRRFALDVAALLTDAQEHGAELEFDVDQEREGRGPVLYAYRPLTEKYLAERWEAIRTLESFAPAGAALGVSAEGWLRQNGLRADDPEPALRAMLERLYEGITSFAFPEERFERLYDEVEQLLYVEARGVRLLAPLPGLELEVERVDLGNGMALVSGEAVEAPPEAVWPVEDPDAGPRALVVLDRDVAPSDPPPVGEARDRFGRLLTGLRLFKPGGVTLSAVGWSSRADARWSPVELGAGDGPPRSEPWILVEGEDAELRAFLDTLEGATMEGAVAWALSRFEMGCSRGMASEALSDYLLALRALIGEDARSGLGLRIAALCAEEHERRIVQRRVELALALERFVMGGGREHGYLEAVGSESPRLLVDEMERHARALLRDVVCGYLEPDLASAADEILLRSTPAAFKRDPEPAPPAEDLPAPQTATAGRSSADTSELEALEEAEPVRVSRAALEPVAYDDDPDDWSAPV